MTVFFVTTERSFGKISAAETQTCDRKESFLWLKTVAYPSGAIKCGDFSGNNLYKCGAVEDGTWALIVICRNLQGGMDCKHESSADKQDYCVDSQGYTCIYNEQKMKFGETKCIDGYSRYCNNDGVVLTKSQCGGGGGTSNGNGGASGGIGSFSDISTPMQWTIGSDPVNYVVVVLKTIIGLAGLVAAALIVFGAYTLITSSGEPENIAKGQKMVTNAIIGLVIAAIAFLIVNYAIDIAKGSF